MDNSTISSIWQPLFPPPHMILFEPLNDLCTKQIISKYKIDNDINCEFDEIDGTQMNSVDTFAVWFDSWIMQVPKKQKSRYKILIIWNSEFLTYSCQQMIRRSLEQRSFRCRVWFHVEDPSTIQPAIISRCIVKRIPTIILKPRISRIIC